MPALPSVPQVVRCDCHFTISEDQNAKCRFFIYYTSAAPTIAEMVAFATSISAAYTAHLKADTPTTVSLTSVVCTDLSSPTSAEGEWTGTITGSNANFAVSAAECVLLSFEVLRRYRGGHPRVYWPMGTQADYQDAQTWKSASVSAWTIAFNAFLSEIIGSYWSGAGALLQVNVGYYEGFTVHTGTTGRARNVSTPRAVPLMDIVVGVEARAGIAIQRKRLLRLA